MKGRSVLSILWLAVYVVFALNMAQNFRNESMLEAETVNLRRLRTQDFFTSPQLVVNGRGPGGGRGLLEKNITSSSSSATTTREDDESEVVFDKSVRVLRRNPHKDFSPQSKGIIFRKHVKSKNNLTKPTGLVWLMSYPNR